MAGLAKVLGVCCLLAAFLLVAVAVWAGASTDWQTLDATGPAGDVAGGGIILGLGALVLVALLFAAVGVGVFVVGDLAQERETDRRATWQRWQQEQAQAPTELPYGATR